MTRPMLLCFRATALSALLAPMGVAALGQTSLAVTLPSPSAASPFLAAAPVSSGQAEPAQAGISSSSAVADDRTPTAASSSDALPNAPSADTLHAAVPESFVFEPPARATPNVAPKLTKYIPSGWTAQPLTGHDKVLLGLRDLYSPLDFVAIIASAGYEHVLNGEPNYGTDRGAFGERLGAAGIRESSQGFLTDSVFSPLFHEDPRYYIQGSGHNFFYRTAYAATRPFITRTDNGNSTINAALLTGYAGSAALSYTYYPQINRNPHDTVATFGSSLGGAALGFFVSEFSDDVLKAIHLRKK